VLVLPCRSTDQAGHFLVTYRVIFSPCVFCVEVEAAGGFGFLLALSRRMYTNSKVRVGRLAEQPGCICLCTHMGLDVATPHLPTGGGEMGLSAFLAAPPIRVLDPANE